MLAAVVAEHHVVRELPHVAARLLRPALHALLGRRLVVELVAEWVQVPERLRVRDRVERAAARRDRLLREDLGLHGSGSRSRRTRAASGQPGDRRVRRPGRNGLSRDWWPMSTPKHRDATCGYIGNPRRAPARPSRRSVATGRGCLVLCSYEERHRTPVSPANRSIHSSSRSIAPRDRRRRRPTNPAATSWNSPRPCAAERVAEPEHFASAA